MERRDPFDHQKLLVALTSLLDALPPHPIEGIQLTVPRRRILRDEIEKTISALRQILFALDPIKLPPHVLDPSDPDVVGRLIAETLLEQDRNALGSLDRFYGSGVYALYYSGSFDAYQPISGSDSPIYVGKADPAVHGAVDPVEQGIRLWNRLTDHKKTISAATNLSIADFDCRYLVVKSAWQGTAETYLIERFNPIWNNETGICYGFGKHGDDPKTRANTRSPWDTLHPGRTWATKQGNRPYHLTPDEIKKQIAEHFLRHPQSKTVS